MVIQSNFHDYDDDWDEDPPDKDAAAEPDPAWNTAGSSFATMHLDAGLLPVRVELSAQWSRYVEPHEVGEELLRAYRGAVAERMAEHFSAEKWPSPESVSESAVPSHRTILMLLLETETWDQYRDTCRAVVGRGDYRVHGRAEVYDEPAVLVRADRTALKSITVWSDWAQQADRMQIADEILYCADQTRALRPRFEVRGDYSRYSVDDLQFQLTRHRRKLFEERER
ncbi:hypothetical protein [Nocardia sp. CNY236]|uniref:hypothetical protein n=1 Tax=Nocardia sp. CNY236 TaxID=1169152 RepID=UPI0004068E04|nr:hypothetical protein [Nocardia sp. CNY236]